jgi:hypothetical protein
MMSSTPATLSGRLERVTFMIPRMNADDREMLKTGIDPECWDKMFPPDDKE